MQEVFEKIIEKLEKEKSKVPVNRLLDDIIKDKPKELGQLMAYSNSVKIVKQVVEEYNNGWILASEKLPDAEDLRNCNLEDCAQYLIQRRSGIMDVAHYIRVYGESYFESNCLRIKDVVAWQPLAEPYQPKGETE